MICYNSVQMKSAAATCVRPCTHPREMSARIKEQKKRETTFKVTISRRRSPSYWHTFTKLMNSS